MTAFIIHSKVVYLLIASALFFVLLILVNRRHLKKRTPIQQPRMPEFRNDAPAVRPHAIFVDLSPKSTDLVELAVEFWRIQNRLAKASANLDDIQKRGLESSVQKLFKYLDRFHMKIVDHTDQKYNEGLSVDVLSFENDPNVSVPMIKETVEPTIICEGKVVKKGKVVVIKNN